MRADQQQMPHHTSLDPYSKNYSENKHGIAFQQQPVYIVCANELILNLSFFFQIVSFITQVADQVDHVGVAHGCPAGCTLKHIMIYDEDCQQLSRLPAQFRLHVSTIFSTLFFPSKYFCFLVKYPSYYSAQMTT